MNNFLFAILLFSLTYTKSICGNSILNQTSTSLNRDIECQDNQFKIRKNVLQSNNSDNFFECVNFIFFEEYSTNSIHFYVEETEYNNGNVTDFALETLYHYFYISTPNAENHKYIYGIKNFSEDFFGPPPNKDGSGIVNILILDIRDNFSGSGNYIAGYFDRNDQSDNSTSNQKDILYIDSNPVDMTNSYPEEALYTLTHEYEHLLHYQSDPNEIINEEGEFNPWLDEGLADLAPTILGLGKRDYGYYLSNTMIGLDEWVNNGLEYYSKSALFMRYIYELQPMGPEIIQDIFNDSDYSSIESIKNILENYDYLDFSDFFDDWVLKTINNDYYLSDCIPDVSPNYTIDNLSNEIINISNLPHYSFYNVMIPAGIVKNQLINLDFRDQSLLNNYNYKNNISPVNEDYWIFADSSYKDDYLYSFINHESSNNSNQIEIVFSGENLLNTIKYDNDVISNYLSFSEDKWYAGVVFNIDTTAMLTSLDYMTSNDSEVNIKINKGGFNYTPQIDTSICLSSGTGWNRINISRKKLYVNDESIYILIEMDENAMGVSNSYNDNLYSYFSTSGNIFSKLDSYFSGNWAVRLSYVDTTYNEIDPNYYCSYVYPNPYNPILDLDLSTFIYVAEHQNYSVDVYDLKGRKVSNLFKGYPAIDILQKVKWDGKDLNGNIVSSGIYILRHLSNSVDNSFFITVIK